MMLLQMDYSPKNGKCKGMYVNMRDMKGDQDKLDSLHQRFDQTLQGSYEVINSQ